MNYENVKYEIRPTDRKLPIYQVVVKPSKGTQYGTGGYGWFVFGLERAKRKGERERAKYIKKCERRFIRQQLIDSEQ